MSKQQQGLRFQNNRQPSATKSVPTGKKQRLTVERLAHDGRGIAHFQNRTWFITNALPSEEVEVRVLSSQSKLVNANCEKVITPSPLRQIAPCPYFGVCGGCELQHLAYEEQVSFKQNSVVEQFQRIAHTTLDEWQAPLVAEPFQYRRRARIAVRYNEQTKQLAIGFRAAFSQQIIAIGDCLVLTESLNQLLKLLPSCLEKLMAPRHIGHIEFFAGDQNALLIRHTAPLTSKDIDTLLAFCEAQQCQLWLQGKAEAEPYMVSSPLSYQLTINQQLFTLNYQMGDFVQVNAAINQGMVQQALDWLQVQAGETVLDLFSGLGNFSLPLAKQAKQVVAVEVIEDMVKLAKENAKLNAIANALFYKADLTQPLANQVWAQQSYAAVLLDPPREGASEIIKQMKKLDTNRILYISCNPATLARDSKLLLEQGFRLKKAGIMDMFPQTSHIETMVLFER